MRCPLLHAHLTAKIRAETFLSVLKAWGTFLAKITGSYDALDNISIFSNFARMWHDFIGSEEFSVERLFEAIMRWLGISIMIQQEEGLRKVIRYEGMGVHPAVLRRFLYTGWTNDTEKRLASHNRGTASKYTRGRRPVEMTLKRSSGQRKRLCRAGRDQVPDKIRKAPDR